MPQNDKAKGMQKFHRITDGTAAASKALVVDGNRDLSNVRNLTVSSLSAGTSGVITGGSLVIGTTPTTLTETELKVLDGVVPGTVTAEKAVVVDTNKDIATFRNLTLSGNLVSGSSTLTPTELGYLDGLTLGTVTASKAVTASANRDVATLRNVTLDGTLTFNAGGLFNADTGTATATGSGTSGSATVNKMAGRVTTTSMTTNPVNSYALTISNSTVATGDLIFATIDALSTSGIPILLRAASGSGTIAISIFNADTVSSFNGPVVVSFLVIKA